MEINIWQALFLGALQGATEFLPVSSSGHLVVVPWLLGWPRPTLTFDTMVHWGTLLAVVVVFWKDLWTLFLAALRSIRDRSLQEPEARVAWSIVIGSIPAAVIGYLFEDFFTSLFKAPMAVGGFLLVTAALLALSEWVGRRTRGLQSVGFVDALVIGTAQAFAIIPGISRSGSTIAAGLVQGLERETAARYSFLLAVPVIFGAGLLKLKHFLATPGAMSHASVMLVGFVAAAIVGYLAIRGLLNYLKTRTLYIFSVYCTFAGLFVLLVGFLR